MSDMQRADIDAVIEYIESYPFETVGFWNPHPMSNFLFHKVGSICFVKFWNGPTKLGHLEEFKSIEEAVWYVVEKYKLIPSSQPSN